MFIFVFRTADQLRSFAVCAHQNIEFAYAQQSSIFSQCDPFPLSARSFQIYKHTKFYCFKTFLFFKYLFEVFFLVFAYILRAISLNQRVSASMNDLGAYQ